MSNFLGSHHFTLGVFLFYAERQNVPHILTFSLEMPL